MTALVSPSTQGTLSRFSMALSAPIWLTGRSSQASWLSGAAPERDYRLSLRVAVWQSRGTVSMLRSEYRCHANP